MNEIAKVKKEVKLKQWAEIVFGHLKMHRKGS